jgi:hypothetical protein
VSYLKRGYLKRSYLVPQIAGKIAGYLDSPKIEHEIAIL